VPAGPRLTREQKKAQTRERLIDAASRVFARKGFAATTLDEIGEEAGLTKGAVYSNFTGKEDLVRSVIEQRLDARLRAIPGEAPPDGPIEEDAARASQQFGAVMHQELDSFLLSLEFVIYSARNPDFREDFVAYHRKGTREMAAIIEERLQAGGEHLDVPAEELSSLFNAITMGVTLERLQNPGGISDELLGRLFVTVVEAFTTREDDERPTST
jgi:AcrR family transcriptional regulator